MLSRSRAGHKMTTNAHWSLSTSFRPFVFSYRCFCIKGSQTAFSSIISLALTLLKLPVVYYVLQASRLAQTDACSFSCPSPAVSVQSILLPNANREYTSVSMDPFATSTWKGKISKKPKQRMETQSNKEGQVVSGLTVAEPSSPDVSSKGFSLFKASYALIIFTSALRNTLAQQGRHFQHGMAAEHSRRSVYPAPAESMEHAFLPDAKGKYSFIPMGLSPRPISKGKASQKAKKGLRTRRSKEGLIASGSTVAGPSSPDVSSDDLPVFGAHCVSTISTSVGAGPSDIPSLSRIDQFSMAATYSRRSDLDIGLGVYVANDGPRYSVANGEYSPAPMVRFPTSRWKGKGPQTGAARFKSFSYLAPSLLVVSALRAVLTVLRAGWLGLGSVFPVWS
ncbi:hypothetical protein DFH11DRAFT_633770 [Phellopilus nigrolimitatus]|nr:hypothetical protein DFH11DRAFT_633770 [Phellopilus nigrolimitatus]